jgi:hypothetical protein
VGAVAGTVSEDVSTVTARAPGGGLMTPATARETVWPAPIAPLTGTLTTGPPSITDGSPEEAEVVLVERSVIE